MAGLAVATVSRLGAAEVVVASRTEANARRLADQYDGRAVPLSQVREALADVDLLVSCTGATGVVLPLELVAAARAGADGPLAVIDLALPHDVDPAVADLPGVSLYGLARLAEEVNEGESATDVAAVREIVAQELAAFLSARRSATVTPTVVALRTMATGIVDGEMQRLMSRLPGLDDTVRAEVEHAVRRVADKLLHQPTVRVKELANESGAVSYAAALAELFSLDPEAVEAVTRAEGI
jgi:glutamyl-tRNA reductase